MGAAITTTKLSKEYKGKAGTIRVVDNLDLYVEEGEIFGFLGPNGAGKTTTIKMLLGIINPSGGEAQILGHDLDDVEVHNQISYLPEKPYYYEHMTGIEILRFYASLFGIKDEAKCLALLERVNLHRDMYKPISNYSKGMQQRIGLAQSLLNDPRLLFLDEPTGGLDPIAHREIRDLILNFREEGKTVFISSHELSDVERICDRVAIIVQGRVVEQGRLDDLLAGGRVEITATDVPETFSKTFSVPDAVVSTNLGRMIVDMPDVADVNAVLDAIRNAKGSIVSMIPRRKRLEDIFIETVRTSGKSNSGDAS